MTILWGGATSSSQYEGEFSQKGLDTQDCRPYRVRTSVDTTMTRLLTKEIVEKAKRDSDEFYPFRTGSKGIAFVDEDLNLIKELGLKIYRFSLSWARLFPNNDTDVNLDAVAYYDKVFQFLKDNNIKIFLSLTHYAVPIRLIDEFGGWKNREMIERYVSFAKFVFQRWGQYVDYWLPFNEINTGFFSPYNGTGLIRDKDEPYRLSDVFQSLHHQFVANARIIKLGRELNVAGKFGCMIACFCYYPLSAKPAENLKLVQEEQVNQWFCADVLIRGKYPYYIHRYFEKHHVNVRITDEDIHLLNTYTCDYLSFSYYSSSVIAIDESEKTAGNLVVTTKNPYLTSSEWGWQIDPIGIQTTLHKAYDRYGVPIVISENGLGANDELTKDNQVHDPYRIAYLKQHFEQIKIAKSTGIPIEAYIAWGIIDIVSAGSCEMAKRYGVVYVDADNLGNGTYKRYKKDSFTWYKQFIEEEN